MYPNPSLHPAPSENPASGYPSIDDFGRRQHHLPADGYVPKIMPAQHQQDQREHSTTCVPSLCPPGIDPSQVDVRTFFPYQPNEVKHRKRTTRQQLKVLEDVYGYDTKPNAALRKRMADELGMTPRGVQVWFQNRRAKEKNLARKAELAIDGGPAIKKPIDLSTSSASASPDVPASSSPTPVPSNPASSTETPSRSSSSGSQDATATSPEGPSPSPSSSPLNSNTSVSRIDTSDASANDKLSFLQSPPEPEKSDSSYLLGTPTRPTAELLAQRRTSLPILSLTPSSSSAGARGLAPRASIHGGGGSGMLSVSHGQAPPNGFDPMLRRRSVDTNIKRLSVHPYAHLARGTNDRFHSASAAHIHSLSESPGRLDGIPGGLGGPGRMGLGLRHGSMPHVLQSPAGNGQRQGAPVPDFAGFAQGEMQSARPTLAPKHSMPTFHEQLREFRPARTISAGHHNTPLFTNPDPFATSLSAGPSLPFDFDSPISPLAVGMQPPASPSSTSPPPISHSLVSGYGGHGLGVPSRSIQPPVPGPLPDASFSFGDPSSSPSMSSSASSSPPSDHSTVVDMRRGSGDSLPETDESAASSSAYDPESRFGSFASMDSQSSWTSYYSDSVDPKEGGGQLDVPDGFDPARRGSFASYHLPELLGGLDVTDAGTSQPQSSYANDAPSEHQELAGAMPAGGRQSGAPTLEQNIYSPHVHQVYGDKQDGYAAQGSYLAQDQSGFAPHGHHMVYPSNGQDPYAQSQDMYSMDKSGVMMGQSVIPHSHSSELAYALQPSGNIHQFSMGYTNDASQGNSHQPSGPDQSNAFDPSEPVHYGHDAPYEHQGNGGYSDEQAYSPYNGQLVTHYNYGIYNGTPMDGSGAVDLGSMCVPASMMDGINVGDYDQRYA